MWSAAAADSRFTHALRDMNKFPVYCLLMPFCHREWSVVPGEQLLLLLLLFLLPYRRHQTGTVLYLMVQYDYEERHHCWLVVRFVLLWRNQL